MSSMYDKLENLKTKASGGWAERAVYQLLYAAKLSLVNGGKFDKLVDEAVAFLDERYREEGCITKTAAQETENMIIGLSGEAKKFKMICAAHAHIDMNWMWGFAETVAVTLDTFRTMLNLMKEYPDFRFSQSQASVYKIVEEFDPDMLEEIKARIKTGQWEVTASTWVETDKNMPNGESLARHILYTKRYLSKLLSIDPESLKLDFEPDTFGHNLNVPEILSAGGVRYYYHCRGYEGFNIYRWESPSGNSVIVYREPLWYNSAIDAGMALYVPEFCSGNGIDSMLKVYGVGDHGGGPTRRDIEKIVDMSAWPVFPSINFGTFNEYFTSMESIAGDLPVVNNELNFVFTGCYTTQTRIKMSNRIGEAKLNEAEALSTISSVFAGGKYPACSYTAAWEKLLFNHFHDILPGSGTVDTREYALGQFQQILAAANTGIGNSMRNIASQVDTSCLCTEGENDFDDRNTVSEGAGVGYSIMDFGVPQTERGRGKTRFFHFFNPSAYDRSEPVEVVVWDWPGNKSRMRIRDSAGNDIRYQLMDGKSERFFEAGNYWGHSYIKLLIDVSVQAYGYSTYVLYECDADRIEVSLPRDPRTELPYTFILENDFIKVDFDKSNATILSIYDKVNGVELIDLERPAGIFRLIREDDAKGMTAWVVGRYMSVTNLHNDVKILQANIDAAALRQWIKYKTSFGNSSLQVTVSLDYDSPVLDFNVECDWQETAKKGSYIPQLNFHMPFGYKCSKYRYDIPFGTIERAELDIDVPANSWVSGIPETSGTSIPETPGMGILETPRMGIPETPGTGIPETPGISGLMVITNSKYGFRGTNNSISVNLIRSSYDPDPYPENGIHKFHFGAAIIDSGSMSNNSMIELAYNYNHPVTFISGMKHSGKLPPAGSFMSLQEGTAVLSAVKMAEDTEGPNRVIVRAYETEGIKTTVRIKFAWRPSAVWYVDLNENKIECGLKIETDGTTVCFEVEASAIATICAEFQG